MSTITAQLTPAELHLVMQHRRRTLHRMRARGLSVYCFMLDQMPDRVARFFTIDQISEATMLSRNTAQYGAAELHHAGIVNRLWHGDERGCLYKLV